jgi:transposase
MQKGTTKRKYTPEFREAAVRLVTVEKVPAAKAAADLGMSVHTLGLWISQARRGAGVFAPPLQQDLAARVRELEAQCRRLTIERDILKKATAFFAKEGGQP